MFPILFLTVFILSAVTSVPPAFEAKTFKVGIEYEHSLPMNGGSDRYRHRNNYDAFFVTVTAAAKNGFVISYLEVTATVDASGEVDFCLRQGQTGSRSMVFSLFSNHSDFLAYSYRAYGIREEEYKKMTNIISLPINSVSILQFNMSTFLLLILTHFVLHR